MHLMQSKTKITKQIHQILQSNSHTQMFVPLLCASLKYLVWFGTLCIVSIQIQCDDTANQCLS